MYVEDGAGVLATVDVLSGHVTIIGNMGVVMTDIAFSPTGQLFGITFNGFYAIDSHTASATLIGDHSVPDANALVFACDGTLYAAGFSSESLFTINPANGFSSLVGNTGFASGGDLAFNGQHLYLASLTNQLVLIDLNNLANSVAVGPFGVPSVFGLATGDNGQLYGAAGTSILSVDVLTGAAYSPVNYSGHGLGAAFGESFYTEAGGASRVPEPGALALLGTALFGLAARQRIALKHSKK